MAYHCSRDWQDTSPPSRNHPFYHKTPSFVRAFSGQDDKSLGNSSAGSRRFSKLTFSGSEVSSIYSYTTADSSFRGHGFWSSSEKPDIETVFEEGCTRPTRQPSLNTLVSKATNRSAPSSYFRDRSNLLVEHAKIHPFANAVLHPSSPPLGTEAPSLRRVTFSDPVNPLLEPKMAQSAALVSTEDDSNEITCPVCVEPMGFRYRLPGEKPPIVPECGHALHEECFSHVYGSVPPDDSRKVLGVCGVCRQPMKLADGPTKRDKLAAMMGQTKGSRNLLPAPSIRSNSSHGQLHSPSDPTSDDPIESSRYHLPEGQQLKVVVPSLSIRSEFSTISRNKKGKQTITTMITVEVPQAPGRGKYPAARRETDDGRSSPQLPPSPVSADDMSSSPPAQNLPTPDPFAHVVQDLKNRIVDPKQLSIDSFGSLRLFDILTVRKDSLARDFHVYLFQEALMCVAEEKKSGFRQIFSSASSIRSEHSGHSSRAVLKVKGRIYLRHVTRVVENTSRGDLSLAILMEEESLESFVLTFKEKSSFENWKITLKRLMDENKRVPKDRIAKLLGAGAPRRSPSRINSYPDLSSPTGSYNATPVSAAFSPESPQSHREPSPGDLAYNRPLAPVHTPLDVVIVLSLPAFNPSQSTPLKVKLMRSSLEFLLNLFGPRDRVSLVSCEMGINGTLRKTPFLSTVRYTSRKRLEAFVETLGAGKQEKDEFEVPAGADEKLDVVTAMNVALDVVLQRKSKNPLSSMIIVSDTADMIKRPQMDLVTARLDAANLPVYAVGYGRSHDPSPLWIVTNHTVGTYTFVKEWYHLRETLAGIIGGMMSVAMDNVKLHVSCVENDFRVVRVQGTTQTVMIGGATKDLDIELQELRFGDKREIIVELELDGPQEQRYSGEGSSESEHLSESVSQRCGSSFGRTPSSNVGMDVLSVSDSISALRENAYEDAVDEVPVCEVDLAFRDPSVGRSVARLPHPELLTIAILPRSTSSSTPADPGIVRRRMELLASDMFTRALLIASRKNYTQAGRILRETKRIVETMQDNMRQHVSENTSRRGRSKREMQAILAVDGLEGPLQDLEGLLDAMEEQKDVFDRYCRNFAAQQSAVLRSQRAWTTRTLSERTYCANEAQNIIQMSAEFQSRFQ
nr:zinc finger family protein [Cryptococcus depauperatus CBS 7855]